MQAYRTLVVLQPTPFCNIDCHYCYLPARSDTRRMSEHTLERVFSRVFASKLVEDPIVFLWHLGEPLAVPPAFYARAFEICREANHEPKRSYKYCFQTNATLLNADWVDLFRRHAVSVGVSLDGPAHIHDRARVARGGAGTHARAMQGIRTLQDGGIRFSTIMVVTAYCLDRADEICDFFLANGIEDIGFNIDEIEGVNCSTSFATAGAVERFRAFFGRVLERASASKGKLRVREVWSNVRTLTGREAEPLNTTNQPFRIFNIDCDGNFTTFCPELVSARSHAYGNFVMGNVETDAIDSIVHNPVFQRVNAEIQAGVAACKRSCSHWAFCGGGSPSNKFFERGRFDVTETLTCSLHKKVVIDVLVDHLERHLGLPSAHAAEGT